jgi:transcriptional regulator with XRE-family HTH domain
VALGRTLRALRLRSHLTQRSAAHRAGVSQSTWSRVERGHLRTLPLDTVRRAFAAIDARIELTPSWRGGAIDRLRDERHAALVAATVATLESWAWQTSVETTYSEYGERGSIDVLATKRELGLALVVEVKSEITSLEATLRQLDVKVRLGTRIVATRSGWVPVGVARILVVEDTMTNRRRVQGLATVLDRAFPVRSFDARRWLRRPAGPCSALVFLSSSPRRTQAP